MAAMENVNVLANERFRELSAVNNTLVRVSAGEKNRSRRKKK